MKIVKSVRDLYADRAELYRRLAADVEERLKPLAEKHGWFFISRVKAIESYALKLETGRVPEPSQLEDFFACTIVVKNLSEIEVAEELVNSIYATHQRRPNNNGFTHKSASSFDFDDLRLLVMQPSSQTGRNGDLDALVFEIQVKTILQYAWGVATHDLIYKTDSISWARERIAFQVKAMLEHAEVAIAEATRLADAPAVAKKDKKTSETLKIMEVIGRTWNNDALPVDRKRLSENILHLLSACDISAENLQGIIDIERRRIGLLPADLSPYGFIVQALAWNSDVAFKAKIERRNFKSKIFVHSGMELPEWMSTHEKVLHV